MIIVWGFKARFKVLHVGHFFCPREGGDREFHRVQARKWFTFFWIPVIPLKVLGEYIECASCKATYEEQVLTLPTTAQIEDRLTTAVRHVIVAMLKADGQVDTLEREAAIRVMKDLGVATYDDAALASDLMNVQVADLETELIAVSGMLSPEGKESLLEAAVALASADGHVEDRESEILLRAGKSLGMSSAHVRGVIAQALEGESAP